MHGRALLLLGAALLPKAHAGLKPEALEDRAALLQMAAHGSRAGQPPNILMIFPDQLRYDWDGFHAPELRLPNLKGLAANGTRFLRAYTPSPLCETSRGALATARDYAASPLRNPDTPFPAGDDSAPTFYSLLREAGYHTMLAGKDHLRGVGGLTTPGAVAGSVLGFDDEIGTIDKYFNTASSGPVEPYGDELAANGSDAFRLQKQCYGGLGFGPCCDEVPLKSLSTMDMNRFLGGGYSCPRFSALPDEHFPDNWVEAVAERLLARKPAGKPWFMQLGFLGPHPPFILTPSMNQSVAGRKYPPPVGNYEFPEEAKSQMRASYAALIENIDAQVGKVLSHLQRTGELGNTVVAFTADHGEMLGDFDLVEKSVPWEGTAHVPLVVSGPGLQRGALAEAPVSTVDVVGTFLELAGARPHAGMTAKSLLPVLEGARKAQHSAVLSGLDFPGGNYDWHMAVRQWRLRRRRGGHRRHKVLKLICCPRGCPTSLANKIVHNGRAELLLQEVAGKPTAREIGSNVLEEYPREAKEMLRELPKRYQESCRHLLARSHGRRRRRA